MNSRMNCAAGSMCMAALTLLHSDITMAQPATFRTLSRIGDPAPETDLFVHTLSLPTISPDGYVAVLADLRDANFALSGEGVFRGTHSSTIDTLIARTGQICPGWYAPPEAPRRLTGFHLDTDSPVSIGAGVVAYAARVDDPRGAPLNVGLLAGGDNFNLSVLVSLGAWPPVSLDPHGYFHSEHVWSVETGNVTQFRFVSNYADPSTFRQLCNGAGPVSGRFPGSSDNTFVTMDPFCSGSGAFRSLNMRVSTAASGAYDAVVFASERTWFFATPCVEDPPVANALYMIDEFNHLRPIAMTDRPTGFGDLFTAFVGFASHNAAIGMNNHVVALEGSSVEANTEFWNVWQYGPFTARRVVREGDALGPSWPGITVGRPPDYFAFLGLAGIRNHALLTPAGTDSRTLIKVRVTGEGITSANDDVLLFEVDVPPSGMRLEPIAWEGQRAPGWPGAVFIGSANDHFLLTDAMSAAVNGQKWVVYAARTTLGQGIFARKPSGERVLIARPGMHITVQRSDGSSSDYIVQGADMYVGITNTIIAGQYAHGCNGVDGIGSPLDQLSHLVIRATLQSMDGSQTETGVYSIDLASLVSADCPADLDDGSGTGTPDGGVTVDDLVFFLAAFDSGSLSADLDDGSGLGRPDGGVTIDDLVYFLLHFEGGC